MIFDNSDVTMIEIESGDVMHMCDESFAELLNEINSKARQTRISAALAWAAAGIGAFAGLASGGPGLLLCTLALPSWAIGKWFDSYRRTTVLYYDLEGDAESAYNHLVQGFDGLNGCAAKWHIEAGGAVQSLTAWKRNAGASHLVNRKATTLAYSLPSVIKSNVTPPALHVGKQIMFFMPDIVLIQDGSRIGAVSYAELNIRWQDSRFIETERVPSDAKIVDHTWKHPNKSGGPDRRFKDNRQIPVCLYEAIHFTSNSGVNELVEFSRIGVAGSFADGCRKLAALPRERTVELPSAPANDVVEAAPTVESVRKRNRLRTVAFTTLGLILGLPALTLLIGSGKQKPDTGPQPNLVAETSGTLSAGNTETAISSAQDANPPLLQSTDVLATPVATSDDLARSEPIVVSEQEGTSVRYTKTMVNLRDGPGTKFAVVAVIQKDIAVSVLEVKGGWSRVRIDEKKNGWMANSTISDRRP